MYEIIDAMLDQDDNDALAFFVESYDDPINEVLADVIAGQLG